MGFSLEKKIFNVREIIEFKENKQNDKYGKSFLKIKINLIRKLICIA